MNEINHAIPLIRLFVYGTLKRGQCREACWPSAPLSVQRAWTRGVLLDTGPYPALIEGVDGVAGEVWTYATDDASRVLEVLDEIEEYQPGRKTGNLYERVTRVCTFEDGSCCEAYLYLYARQEDLPLFRKVEPTYLAGDLRLAVWPAGAAW